MAPWVGRVRRGRFRFDGADYSLPLTLPPHAIHGTTYTRPWRDEGGNRLSIDLGETWPFAGRAVQEFAIDAGGLDLRLEVHSDDEPFPASLGWHPWFRRQLERGEPVELSIAARAMYLRDADGIPTGECVPPPPGPWDDCFTDVTEPPSLCWPGALRIALESSADHWVVYDEPEHAVCVEPQTGPPDALNLAPRVVSPEHPLVATTRLAWTLDPSGPA
jgi:aldose 1-epimerase